MGVVYRVSSVFQVLALVLQPSSSEIVHCCVRRLGEETFCLALFESGFALLFTYLHRRFVDHEGICSSEGCFACFKEVGEAAGFQSSCSTRVSSRQWPSRQVLIVRWKTVCRRPSQTSTIFRGSYQVFRNRPNFLYDPYTRRSIADDSYSFAFHIEAARPRS